jgi:hypothetical protein
MFIITNNKEKIMTGIKNPKLMRPKYLFLINNFNKYQKVQKK